MALDWEQWNSSSLRTINLLPHIVSCLHHFLARRPNAFLLCSHTAALLRASSETRRWRGLPTPSKSATPTGHPTSQLNSGTSNYSPGYKLSYITQISMVASSQPTLIPCQPFPPSWTLGFHMDISKLLIVWLGLCGDQPPTMSPSSHLTKTQDVLITRGAYKGFRSSGRNCRQRPVSVFPLAHIPLFGNCKHSAWLMQPAFSGEIKPPFRHRHPSLLNARVAIWTLTACGFIQAQGTRCCCLEFLTHIKSVSLPWSMDREAAFIKPLMCVTNTAVLPKSFITPHRTPENGPHQLPFQTQTLSTGEVRWSGPRSWR